MNTLNDLHEISTLFQKLIKCPFVSGTRQSFVQLKISCGFLEYYDFGKDNLS